MQAPQERLAGIISATRIRLGSRLRSTLFIVLLLAALVWFTKWPSLRAGLVILLLAQFGVAVVLLLRRRALASQMGAHQTDLSDAAAAAWFDQQARFVKTLAVCENAARALGFLVLGWGFWTATRQLPLSLALGVGYPFFAYFAMDRRNQARAVRSLQIEKDAFALHDRGARPND